MNTNIGRAFKPRVILGTGLAARREAEAEATRMAALGGSDLAHSRLYFDGDSRLEALRRLTGADTNRFLLGRDE